VADTERKAILSVLALVGKYIKNKVIFLPVIHSIFCNTQMFPVQR
jgi:hypothetical protein